MALASQQNLPRKPESQLTQVEMDMAASVQKVTEEVMMKLAKHAHELTGSKNLVMAGGVALNCVANGILLREGPFENIWIQPAAGDAGGALGAAAVVWHDYLSAERQVNGNDAMHGSYPNDAASETLCRQAASPNRLSSFLGYPRWAWGSTQPAVGFASLFSASLVGSPTMHRSTPSGGACWIPN